MVTNAASWQLTIAIDKHVQSPRRSCQHCGSPYAPHHHSKLFCCAGCESVYGLIRDQGFAEYYALKSGVTEPVKETPFATQDWQWLVDVATQAEINQSGSAQAEFAIVGVSCAGCAWLAQQVIQRHRGIKDIGSSESYGQLQISWVEGQADLLGLAKELQQFGFLLQKRTKSFAPPSLAPLIFGAVLAGSALLFQVPRLLGITDEFPLARVFDLTSILLGALCLILSSQYLVRKRFYTRRIKS